MLGFGAAQDAGGSGVGGCFRGILADCGLLRGHFGVCVEESDRKSRKRTGPTERVAGKPTVAVGIVFPSASWTQLSGMAWT